MSRRANDRAVASADPDSPEARGWTGSASAGVRLYRGLRLEVTLTARAWVAVVARPDGHILAQKRSIATRLKAERFCLRKAQALLGEQTTEEES